MENQYVDITKDISTNEFQTMVAFVLKEGDRRFYCNKYNNSPHYKVDSFDVYLNPVSQFVNWTKEDLSTNVIDYNVIVIRYGQSDVQYYSLVLKDALVLLKCYDQKDKALFRKVFLERYLPAIKKYIY